MIQPLYVMKMSLGIPSAPHLSRGQRDSHDHKGVKVLNTIQDRLDEMRPSRHLVLVLPWPEEEGGSLSNRFPVIINGSVTSKERASSILAGRTLQGKQHGGDAKGGVNLRGTVSRRLVADAS